MCLAPGELSMLPMAKAGPVTHSLVNIFPIITTLNLQGQGLLPTAKMQVGQFWSNWPEEYLCL